MKHISLGLPLTISLIGTLGSLATKSEKAHVAFGAAFTGLSLVHVFQHRKALQIKTSPKKAWQSVTHHLPHQPALLQGPRLKLHRLGHTEVAFYMPGRIRLYCRELRGNESYKKVLWSQLEEFRKIGHLDMNSLTGSVLITYDPEQLEEARELKKIASYAEKHAKKKDVSRL